MFRCCYLGIPIILNGENMASLLCPRCKLGNFSIFGMSINLVIKSQRAKGYTRFINFWKLCCF